MKKKQKKSLCSEKIHIKISYKEGNSLKNDFSFFPIVADTVIRHVFNFLIETESIKKKIKKIKKK